MVRVDGKCAMVKSMSVWALMWGGRAGERG